MARKLDPERTLPTGIDSGLGVMPTVVWIASVSRANRHHRGGAAAMDSERTISGNDFGERNVYMIYTKFAPVADFRIAAMIAASTRNQTAEEAQQLPEANDKR